MNPPEDEDDEVEEEYMVNFQLPELTHCKPHEIFQSMKVSQIESNAVQLVLDDRFKLKGTRSGAVGTNLYFRLDETKPDDWGWIDADAGGSDMRIDTAATSTQPQSTVCTAAPVGYGTRSITFELQTHGPANTTFLAGPSCVFGQNEQKISSSP